MDIEAPQCGGAAGRRLRHRVEHPLRQDQTVRGHNHAIGPGHLDGLTRCFGIVRKLALQAQAAWLAYGNSLRLRRLFDR
jgi:hypothetical protein